MAYSVLQENIVRRLRQERREGWLEGYREGLLEGRLEVFLRAQVAERYGESAAARADAMVAGRDWEDLLDAIGWFAESATADEFLEQLRELEASE